MHVDCTSGPRQTFSMAFTCLNASGQSTGKCLILLKFSTLIAERLVRQSWRGRKQGEEGVDIGHCFVYKYLPLQLLHVWKSFVPLLLLPLSCALLPIINIVLPMLNGNLMEKRALLNGD